MKKTHKLLALSISAGIPYEVFLDLRVNELIDVINFISELKSGKEKKKVVADLSEYQAPEIPEEMMRDFYD